MSLSEQNKRELISMATGEANEPTQARLRQLIEKDDECRTYWGQLTELHQTLAKDADLKETVPLPPGFHQRLTTRLPPHTTVGAETSQLLASYWRTATSAAFAVGLLALLAIQWFTPQENSTTPLKKNMAQIQPSSPAPNSWAALRVDSSDLKDLFVASTSSPITSKIPSMNWADRETWIKELDL